MQPNEDVRQMLAYIADRNKRGQAARKAGEPEVGVFFVYSGKFLMDGWPFSVYGMHGLDHHSSWKWLQGYGIVPDDVNYDEIPRGRVEYDINEEKFHVYADSCILSDAKTLDEINREFHLTPANTKEPERDLRYLCAGCKGPTKEEE